MLRINHVLAGALLGMACLCFSGCESSSSSSDSANSLNSRPAPSVESVKGQISSGVVVLALEKHGCKSCQQMEPIINQAVSDTGVKLVRVFPDNALMGEFQVGSFPTIIVYNNGQECDRWIGYRSASEMVDMINRGKKNLAQ